MDEIKEKDATFNGTKNTAFAKGDIVLACYVDGVYYKAEIIQFCDGKSNCIIKYIDYEDFYSVSFDKIKSLNLDTKSKAFEYMIPNGALPINQNSNQEVLETNVEVLGEFDKQLPKSNTTLNDNQVEERLQYLVGDTVLALYDDGKEYIAKLTEIGDNGKCIVTFIEYNDVYKTSIENIKHIPQNSSHINEQCVKVVSTTNDSCETIINKDFPEYKSETLKKVEDFKDDNDNITVHNENIKNLCIETKHNEPKNLVKEQQINTKASDKNFEKGEYVITAQNNGRTYHAEVLDVKHNENVVVVKFLKSNEVHALSFDRVHSTGAKRNDSDNVVVKNAQSKCPENLSGVEKLQEGDFVKANEEGEVRIAQIVKITDKGTFIVKYEDSDDLYEMFSDDIEAIVASTEANIPNVSVNESHPTTESIEELSKSLESKKIVVDDKNNVMVTIESNSVLQQIASDENDTGSKCSNKEDRKLQEGDNVLAVYSDGEYYPAKIVKFCDKDICKVVYTDYGEALYEVEISKIKITDNESNTLINNIEKVSSSELNIAVFSESTETQQEAKENELWDVSSTCTNVEYSVGDNVLAIYNGEKYPAKVISISAKENIYIIKYDGYEELYEVSLNDIEPSPVRNLKNDEEEGLLPEFLEGTEVLVKYKDDNYYKAKIVSISSNNTSCIIKYIDYDEYGEVYLNDVIRADDQLDYDYEHPATNLGEVQELLTNHLTKIDEGISDIKFKPGQRVFALYEDGVYYPAIIIKCSIENNNCSIIYEGFSDVIELNLNEIKPIEFNEFDYITYNTDPISTTYDNVPYNNKLKSKAKSNIKYSVDDKVMAKYENGEDYEATIYEFLDENICIVQFVNNEFAKAYIGDIKPIQSNRIHKKKVISETVSNNASIEENSVSNADREVCKLEKNGYKKNLENSENISKSFNETSVSNKAYELKKNDISEPSNETSLSNKRRKSSYSENDIIEAIHSDGKQYIGEIMKILNTDLCLVKFNDLNEIYEVELNKIIEKLDMDFSVTDNSSVTLKVPKFLEHELVVAESKDGEQYDVEIIKIVPANGTYIVKSIGTNKYFETDFDAVKSKTNITSSEPEYFVQSTTEISCRSESALTTNPMEVVQNNVEYAQPLVVVTYSDGRNYPAKVIHFNSDTNTCFVKFLDVDVFQEVHIANLKPFTFYETPGILRQQLSNPVDYSYSQSGSNSIILKPKNQQLTNSNFSTEQVFGTQSPNDMHMTSLLNLQQGLVKMDEDEDIVKQVAQRANGNVQIFNKPADDFQNRDHFTVSTGYSNREHYSGTNLKVGDFVRAFYFDGQIYDAQVISIFETNQTCQINYLALNIQQNIPWRYVHPMQSTNRDFLNVYPKDVLNTSTVMGNQNPGFMYWFLRGYYSCFHQTFLANK